MTSCSDPLSEPTTQHNVICRLKWTRGQPSTGSHHRGVLTYATLAMIYNLILFLRMHLGHFNNEQEAIKHSHGKVSKTENTQQQFMNILKLLNQL